MANALTLALPVVLFAVVATLCVGIFSLFRGGEFARSYSNKLMRLRVALQFLAVVVLLGAFYFSRSA